MGTSTNNDNFPPGWPYYKTTKGRNQPISIGVKTSNPNPQNNVAKAIIMAVFVSVIKTNVTRAQKELLGWLCRCQCSLFICPGDNTTTEEGANAKFARSEELLKRPAKPAAQCVKLQVLRSI